MIIFGTLGAARITPRALLYPAGDERRAFVRSVAARDRNRAEKFAEAHNIPHVYDGYDDVINDEKVDAIYIPLAISDHHHWTLAAIKAGKHVLCEKSFSSNAAEAEEMRAAADAAGLVCIDAFHYRYHPLFDRVRQIYQSGELGDIQQIDAAFHIPVPIDTDDIRMIYETGGGVTMDIGCYPISWIRHLTDLEPETVTARAEIGPPDVDVELTAEMTLPGGIKATTSGDMRGGAGFRADILVTGTQGTMTVINPLAPQAGNEVRVNAGGRARTETFDRRTSYSYQLEAFCDAVLDGKPCATDAADAVKQMALIDRCYEAAGMRLRGESS